MATPIPTAGELGQVLSGDMQLVVLLLVGVGAAVYWVYDNVDRRVFEEFEKKPLGQKVIEDLKYRLKKIGKSTDKQLLKDMDKKGDVQFYDTYRVRSDTPVTPLLDSGKADEEDTKEVMVMMTAPSKEGLIGKIKYGYWLFDDYLLSGESHTDIYIAETDAVENTRHAFVLDKDIQMIPTTFASNVLVQNSQAATNIVNQIATVDAQGEMLNSMTEFLSKVEHFEIEHLKNMNMMDKKAEIEKQSFMDDFKNS